MTSVEGFITEDECHVLAEFYNIGLLMTNETIQRDRFKSLLDHGKSENIHEVLLKLRKYLHVHDKVSQKHERGAVMQAVQKKKANKKRAKPHGCGPSLASLHSIVGLLRQSNNVYSRTHSFHI